MHGSALQGFQWNVATSASTQKVPQFMLRWEPSDSRFFARNRFLLFGRDLSVLGLVTAADAAQRRDE
jgi:hypothetical protein